MQAFGTIDAASLQQLSANHTANMHMLALGENTSNNVPEERWDKCSVNTAIDIHGQDDNFRDDTSKKGSRSRGKSRKFRFWRAKISS